MASYFPRHTIELRLEEAKAFRRLSFNLVEMALLTGVVLRLYRSVVLTHGSGSSWVYIVGTLLLGVVFVCGMTAAHLANFPLRKWTWRAPLFALCTVVAEMATSLMLIFVGREPTGTARAGFQDWVGMSWSTLWTRELVICVWAAVLALIVTLVRRAILTAERIEKHEREREHPPTG
jgi:hypothetical protein